MGGRTGVIGMNGTVEVKQKINATIRLVNLLWSLKLKTPFGLNYSDIVQFEKRMS